MKMNTASQIAEEFQSRVQGGEDAQEALQATIEAHLGAHPNEYKAHVYAYIIDYYEGERLSAIITEAMIYERT
ncbi:hypothetical protein CPT_Percy29 [Caulobacter phage Percy]|uniref:Uncharacterized protein n=1 Tax=Caulobacter phage Percy TaxID=1701809 RepID=A0A0M3UL65_9CAUD|nr:hypothetical protein CPT_Percy29 [Caulobacter phage Percy]ALF01663.1 hypothetical protein CPT_Percy29 [Caulobacter phage Percy]